MSLKQAYAPYFKIGTSVSWRNLASDRAKEELNKHYNNITAENAMKPMFYLNKDENQAHQKGSISCCDGGCGRDVGR